MNFQLTQAGATLTNTFLSGNAPEGLKEAIESIGADVFQAFAQLHHGMGTEGISAETLEALTQRGFVEVETTETETEEIETVTEALTTASNERNYTPIHEARRLTNLSAEEFRAEMLKLVESGDIELSSIQEMGEYSEEYFEDAIELDPEFSATIWFFYIIN